MAEKSMECSSTITQLPNKGLFPYSPTYDCCNILFVKNYYMVVFCTVCVSVVGYDSVLVDDCIAENRACFSLPVP